MDMKKDFIPLEGDEKKNKISAETGTVTHYIMQLYDEFGESSYRQKLLDERKDGRNRYEMELPHKDFPNFGEGISAANYTLGMERIGVDSLEPRFMTLLFGNQADIVTTKPMGAEDVDKAEQAQTEANYLLTENAKLPAKFQKILHNLLLDGYVDVIPVWEETEKTRKVRTLLPVFRTPDGSEFPVDPKALKQMSPILMRMGAVPVGEMDQIDETSYDCWKVRLDIVRPSDAFWPDNWKEDFGNQPYIRMIYPTLYELRAMSEENGGPYFNITDELVVDPERNTTDTERDSEEERLGIRYSEFSGEVRVAEGYVRIDGEWWIVSHAVDSGWVKIREQRLSDVYPDGEKPVVRFSLYDAVSVPKLIKSMSEGSDDFFNMMVDACMVEILPAGFVTVGPGMTTDLNFQLGEFKEIPKGSEVNYKPKNVAPLEIFIQFIQLLNSFSERILSVINSSVPDTDMGGDTFSGRAMVHAENSIQHSYRVDYDIRVPLERLVKKMMGLYAIYMPTDAKKRIWQDERWVFEQIDTKALQGSYDYTLEITGKSPNSLMNRQEAIQRLQLFMQFPFMNVDKLVKDALKMFGIRDIQSYIAPGFQMLTQAYAQDKQGVAQAVQQYMAQKAQQMQQQQMQQEVTNSLQKSELRSGMKDKIDDRNVREDMARDARRGVIRQDEKRKMEKLDGIEDRKLIDQAVESRKKKEIFEPMVENLPINELFSRR